MLSRKRIFQALSSCRWRRGAACGAGFCWRSIARSIRPRTIGCPAPTPSRGGPPLHAQREPVLLSSSTASITPSRARALTGSRRQPAHRLAVLAVNDDLAFAVQLGEHGVALDQDGVPQPQAPAGGGAGGASAARGPGQVDATAEGGGQGVEALVDGQHGDLPVAAVQAQRLFIGVGAGQTPRAPAKDDNVDVAQGIGPGPPAGRPSKTTGVAPAALTMPG